MQNESNYITGDFIKLQNITKDWSEVEIHPQTFYRDSCFNDYQEAAKVVKHLYTDLEDDRRAVARFQYDEDAVAFKLKYESLG